jgi:hypothetical protein
MATATNNTVPTAAAAATPAPKQPLVALSANGTLVFAPKAVDAAKVVAKGAALAAIGFGLSKLGVKVSDLNAPKPAGWFDAFYW